MRTIPENNETQSFPIEAGKPKPGEKGTNGSMMMIIILRGLRIVLMGTITH